MLSNNIYKPVSVVAPFLCPFGLLALLAMVELRGASMGYVFMAGLGLLGVVMAVVRVGQLCGVLRLLHRRRPYRNIGAEEVDVAC